MPLTPPAPRPMGRTSVSRKRMAWPSWLARKIIFLPSVSFAPINSSLPSSVMAMIPVERGLENSVSAVKKSALTEFSNPRSTGIIAITLDGKDELIGAKLTDGKKMIFLASHEGQAILFRETEVRPMGRGAGGVNGMDLDEEDYVVSMDAVQPDFEIIAKEHN